MSSAIEIRPAQRGDAALVADILQDAAAWLDRAGMPLWRDHELAPAGIAADVAAGLHWILDYGGEPAATVRFQLEDPVAWPQAPTGEAAYIHRLARRERFAGCGLGSAALAWAADRSRTLERRFLRLDTEASRLRLRAQYEAFGFRLHSYFDFGPYHAARYELKL